VKTERTLSINLEANLVFVSLLIRCTLSVQIANAMGEDVSNLSMREAAYRGIYAVKKLLEDLNLPTSLSRVKGADKRDLAKIVEILAENPRAYQAFADDCKRKMTKEDIKKLLENIWEGTLGKP